MMNSVKRIAILILLCRIGFTVSGNTGEPASLNEAEIKLQVLFSRISVNNTDELNLQISDTLNRLLENTLHMPGSFEYSFDSLKFVGRITSPDKAVRIFTWNLFRTDATNRFFGFVMHRISNTRETEVISLTDSSEILRDPLNAVLTAKNWYGCLIYDIIQTKDSGVTYYTLLGYHPENLFITRKLLDVLWFDNGKPAFGKAIFKNGNRIENRMLFTYSAKVQMSIKWNAKMKMIILDHLAPFEPSYKGNYQYYGPDSSYDGLRFEQGVWEMVENVDVRNEEK